MIPNVSHRLCPLEILPSPMPCHLSSAAAPARVKELSRGQVGLGHESETLLLEAGQAKPASIT